MDGKTEQTFDAMDWFARIVVHIPNKYDQLAEYVGYYSNKSRGMRKKAGNRRHRAWSIDVETIRPCTFLGEA